MSVVNQSYFKRAEKRNIKGRSTFFSYDLFSRSFAANKLFRQFPLLAALHRVTDGALLGLTLTIVVMSVISLHAQHLWTLSFSRLESSRTLISKLKESISILESHYLTLEVDPEFMVETKTSDLLYLDKPDKDSQLPKVISNEIGLVRKIMSYPVNHGY